MLGGAATQMKLCHALRIGRNCVCDRVCRCQTVAPQGLLTFPHVEVAETSSRVSAG